MAAAESEVVNELISYERIEQFAEVDELAVRSGFDPAKNYAHHQLVSFTKNTVEAEELVH